MDSLPEEFGLKQFNLVLIVDIFPLGYIDFGVFPLDSYFLN